MPTYWTLNDDSKKELPHLIEKKVLFHEGVEGRRRVAMAKFNELDY